MRQEQLILCRFEIAASECERSVRYGGDKSTAQVNSDSGSKPIWPLVRGNSYHYGQSHLPRLRADFGGRPERMKEWKKVGGAQEEREEGRYSRSWRPMRRERGSELERLRGGFTAHFTFYLRSFSDAHAALHSRPERANEPAS